MRVLPQPIGYPSLVDNYPKFYEEIGLPHMAVRYMPREMKSKYEREQDASLLKKLTSAEVVKEENEENLTTLE